MNCATCDHWEPRNEYEAGHGMGLGQCTNVPMFFDATEWNEDGEGRAFKPEYANCKAFAQDASDYRAYLLTKPDFGCVAHSTVVQAGTAQGAKP
jgi:hypothetical protein